MTERLHFHFSLSCIGEGNGNPLQCSCLENPRDGEAWWAAIHGVAQSRTRLKRLSSSSSSIYQAAMMGLQGACQEFEVTSRRRHLQYSNTLRQCLLQSISSFIEVCLPSMVTEQQSGRGLGLGSRNPGTCPGSATLEKRCLHLSMTQVLF